LHYWQGRTEIVEVEMPHFPFFFFKGLTTQTVVEDPVCGSNAGEINGELKRVEYL
jgi:hypothetical protein